MISLGGRGWGALSRSPPSVQALGPQLPRRGAVSPSRPVGAQLLRFGPARPYTPASHLPEGWPKPGCQCGRPALGGTARGAAGTTDTRPESGAGRGATPEAPGLSPRLVEGQLPSVRGWVLISLSVRMPVVLD